MVALYLGYRLPMMKHSEPHQDRVAERKKLQGKRTFLFQKQGRTRPVRRIWMMVVSHRTKPTVKSASHNMSWNMKHRHKSRGAIGGSGSF